MGSSAVDLDKHSLALLAAKSDVVSGRAAASWIRKTKGEERGGAGPGFPRRKGRSQLCFNRVPAAAPHLHPRKGGHPTLGRLEAQHEPQAGTKRGNCLLLRGRGRAWPHVCRALFAYEKSNELKLLDSGGGGPDELAKRFQSGRIMYGLCRLSESAAGTPRIVLIHWVGEKVSDSQQEACAGHLPAIRTFFKEAHLVLKASRAEEVTQEGLTRRLSLVAPSGAVFSKQGVGSDPQELVGTNYRKTNPLLEILHTKRSSFWAQAEREEEQRREEERRRAQEERRHWERLRMEEERREAAERERRVQEKEKLIQEQRKQQAQRDAEEHRWEEARRKEQAKAISGMSLQSQPSEKARQEAAMPGLQQPHPPQGFFQKRERLGSASGDPGPGMPRRPFLRYQRSLTESAYIFRRPDPDLSGSFQASVPYLAPSIGPKPSTPTPVPERRLPGTGSLPEPALPPTSSPPVPAPCETEAAPPCSTPCLAPPALNCALNGAEAESASPPQSPELAPSPENESESPWGQGSQCSVVLGPCCPLAAPYEEALPPSHAPEGQVSPSPAPGASGGAMDWEELPSPRVNSPSTHPGETVPAKGGSAGVAPGQAGSMLPSVRNGTGEER